MAHVKPICKRIFPLFMIANAPCLDDISQYNSLTLKLLHLHVYLHGDRQDNSWHSWQLGDNCAALDEHHCIVGENRIARSDN